MRTKRPEPTDIKIRAGMTLDEIQAMTFVMRPRDAEHLRAVVEAGEAYLSVLRAAHAHFDELMTAVQSWTHQHAVEFGLSCDVHDTERTVEKARKLLGLGAED